MNNPLGLKRYLLSFFRLGCLPVNTYPNSKFVVNIANSKLSRFVVNTHPNSKFFCKIITSQAWKLIQYIKIFEPIPIRPLHKMFLAGQINRKNVRFLFTTIVKHKGDIFSSHLVQKISCFAYPKPTTNWAISDDKTGCAFDIQLKG